MAPSRKPAHRYHHGDLRKALLDAAWSHVSRKGVGSLSLRALADAAGVSHAAPAHHFADKEELLDALTTSAWSRFADALAKTSAAADPLRAAGEAYIDFAIAHPRQLQLMFRPSARPATDEARAAANRAWLVLRGAVARHVGAKAVAKEPQRLDALSLSAWSAVHGLGALLTEASLPEELPKSGPALRALKNELLEMVLRGLKAR